ncbi:hypothetical protein ACQ4WX_07105 [Streptomyces lasalocidi]
MTLINGLPAHVLFVHVVVVLIPLTALALVTAALWPRAARRLGMVLPLVALVALVSVPLTTHAGEWLERHVDSDPSCAGDTELGDGLLPWALGLFVLAAVVWWSAGAPRRSPARAVAPCAGRPCPCGSSWACSRWPSRWARWSTSTGSATPARRPPGTTPTRRRPPSRRTAPDAQRARPALSGPATCREARYGSSVPGLSLSARGARHSNRRRQDSARPAPSGLPPHAAPRPPCRYGYDGG